MTTMSVHQVLPRPEVEAIKGLPPRTIEPNRGMSPAQIEQRITRVGWRTLIHMVGGVALVSFTLAVLLAGWDLALLFTVGTTLFALLFGGPFWIAAYDDVVRAELDRCLARQSR